MADGAGGTVFVNENGRTDRNGIIQRESAPIGVCIQGVQQHPSALHDLPSDHLRRSCGQAFGHAVQVFGDALGFRSEGYELFVVQDGWIHGGPLSVHFEHVLTGGRLSFRRQLCRGAVDDGQGENEEG